MPEYGNYYRPTPQQVLQKGQIVWSGEHPLNKELQNPATAALAGVASGAVIWTGAEVASQLAGEAIFKDGEKVGSFTKAAKDNLFEAGIKTKASTLFNTGDAQGLFGKADAVLRNSGELAKTTGTAFRNFGEELWKSPTNTGKWMAATVAAGALFSGGLNAYHAHRDNQNLVSGLKAEKAFPQDNHQKLAFTSGGKKFVAQRAEPGQLTPENSVDIRTAMENEYF
jgi:hypothetical protein